MSTIVRQVTQAQRHSTWPHIRALCTTCALKGVTIMAFASNGAQRAHPDIFPT
jgi:hypothetical protein